MSVPRRAGPAKGWRERLAGASVALVRRIPLFEAALLGAVAATLLLMLSPLGEGVNDALYLEPLMRFRIQLGLQPRLDPSVRVVLLEDKSLEKLGRQPTFGEWQRIAGLLLAEGFERVVLLGVHNLRHELGELQPRADSGRLILGAVVSPEQENLRTRSFAEIPARFFVDPTSDAGLDLLPQARIGIVPHPDILALGDRLGSLNILTNYTMPIAYVVPGGRLLPNIALYALDGLQWVDGAPRNGKGPIPVSEDQSLYIDLVDPRASFDQTVPAGAFFAADGETLRDHLTPKVKAKLAGGRIGVLVPDGYTGSRFIDSPAGKVLSYFSVLSAMNSVIKGRFLYRPLPFATCLLWAAPVVYLALRMRRMKRAAAAAAGLTVLTLGASLWSYHAFGWILPCIQLLALVAVPFLVRAVLAVSKLVTEKLLLNKELEMGTAVQRLILPQAATGVVGKWRFKVVFRPYGHMAGDWFQIYTSPPEVAEPFAVLAIGDVVGKGASAALNTALIAGIWNDGVERWADEGFDSARFVASLQRAIHNTFKGQQSTTLSLAFIRGDVVELICIGGPSWIRFAPRTGESGRLRMKSANPLGWARGAFAVPSLQRTAAPGEVYVAFTDGVIDGSRGENTFMNLLGKVPMPDDTETLLDAVAQVAVDVGADSALPDDLTLLLLRREEEPASAVEPTPAAAS